MPLQPAAASLPEDSGHGNSGRYLFFGLAGLGLLMVSINATIVAVAIPTLTTALNTSLNWVSWTLTSYLLVQIVAMPVLGGLSDSLGRKRVFMFCIAFGACVFGFYSFAPLYYMQ